MLQTFTLTPSKTIFATFFLFSTLLISSQTSWIIDQTHGHMGFSLQYMSLGEYSGRFKFYDGKVNSKSETDFSDAIFNIIIDMNTVSAEVEGHDEILTGKNYFDTKTFPFATFRSTSMKPSVVIGTYNLEGNLTIKDITKKINFTVIGAPRPITNPYFNTTNYGLTLTSSIRRSDFGIGPKEKMDNGELILGDEVKLFCTLILVKSTRNIPMAELNTVKVDEIILEQYVGKYDFGKDGILSISKEKDKLFAIGKSGIKKQIFPLSENKFFFEFKDSYYEFIKDINNKIVKVIQTYGTGDNKYEGLKIADSPAK